MDTVHLGQVPGQNFGVSGQNFLEKIWNLALPKILTILEKRFGQNGLVSSPYFRGNLKPQLV